MHLILLFITTFNISRHTEGSEQTRSPCDTRACGVCLYSIATKTLTKAGFRKSGLHRSISDG